MRRNFTIDTALQLKDAGLVPASAPAQVGGADKVLDLGKGFVEGDVLIDISACEIASNDEIFDIVVQLSNDDDFSTKTDVVERCSMCFCALEVTRTDGTVDAVAGRFVLSFDNEYAGTIYRYLRLYTVAAGTIASGINYTAYVAKRTPVAR